MSLQNQGFLVFILVMSLNVLALLLDWYLHCHHQMTITQYVWKEPLIGVPIVGLQMVGTAGLIVHFYLA